MKVVLAFFTGILLHSQALAVDPASVVQDSLDQCRQSSWLEPMLTVIGGSPKGANLQCYELNVQADVYSAIDNKYSRDISETDALFRSQVKTAESLLNNLPDRAMVRKTLIRFKSVQEPLLQIVGPSKTSGTSPKYTEVSGSSRN